MRPEQLVLVTGTGTGVGKTWVAAQLLAAWRAGGATVAARKPVQSFAVPAAEPGARPGAADVTDAEVLAGATGEHRHAVCPEHRWYPLAMAPPMAAEVLGRPAFTVAELVGEMAWPPGARVRYGVVEGAGGPRSPLAADGDTVSLAQLLEPDRIVLVADAGLGAINAVLLACGAFAGAGPDPVVLLNRFDGIDAVHVANLAWLRRHTALAVASDVTELVGLLFSPPS